MRRFAFGDGLCKKGCVLFGKKRGRGSGKAGVDSFGWARISLHLVGKANAKLLYVGGYLDELPSKPPCECPRKYA